jgi:hypothetical protein
MLSKLLPLLSLALCFSSSALAQPSGWWKKSKGIMINSPEELDELIEQNPNTFILLDFYM